MSTPEYGEMTNDPDLTAEINDMQETFSELEEAARVLDEGLMRLFLRLGPPHPDPSQDIDQSEI